MSIDQNFQDYLECKLLFVGKLGCKRSTITTNCWPWATLLLLFHLLMLHMHFEWCNSASFSESVTETWTVCGFIGQMSCCQCSQSFQTSLLQSILLCTSILTYTFEPPLWVSDMTICFSDRFSSLQSVQVPLCDVGLCCFILFTRCSGSLWKWWMDSFVMDTAASLTASKEINCRVSCQTTAFCI